MSGLKSTGKRLFNASLNKGYKTNEELRQEKAQKRQSALNKIYQGAEMPDPEEQKRQARKKAATRRGSRASTILTDDTLG